MRTFVLAVTIAILGASTVGSARAQAPSADDILNRYIEAAGGREALQKLTTRVMKGRIGVSTLGMSGEFVQKNKAPNLQATKTDFDGLPAMEEGHDGKVAWATLPGLGAREKSGGELARAKRSSVFPRELRLRDTYARFAVKGLAKIGDRSAWLVVATPSVGKPDHLYFDQQTGLLLREETTVESSLVGELTFQIDYGDYRKVDGVMVPFSIAIPKPVEMGFSVKIEDVKHNVDIPDTAFAKP